jgi:hypothetical protein
MSAQPQATEREAALVLRACIQKVATGPEYSKNLSFEETRCALRPYRPRSYSSRYA